MAFYQHYAGENGMTLSQVKQKVSRWDMDQWKQAVDEIDMDGWPKDATDRVRFYNMAAGFDKSKMIGAVIALGIIRMTVKNEQTVQTRSHVDGLEEINRMQKTMRVTKPQKKKLTTIINSPETRQEWSQSLWVDSDKLANDVEYLVNQHLKHSMSLDDLGKLLQKHMKPSQFKPKQSIADRTKQMNYIAKRLVRSESARLVDIVNTTSFKMKGVKSVDWIAEPTACDDCAALADASPFLIDEAPMVVDDTHPGCRCIKIPHIE